MLLDNYASPQTGVMRSWGSPPKPSESQIEELKAYSEIRPHLLPWTTSGADVFDGLAAATKTTTIILPPNTAAVVVV